MVLFVFCKLILQTRMRSQPMGLDVWCLVGPFVYFKTLCVRTAKALARLHRCAGLPEPLLVAYVISTIISWAGSYGLKSDLLRLVLYFCFLELFHGILGQFETDHAAYQGYTYRLITLCPESLGELMTVHQNCPDHQCIHCLYAIPYICIRSQN